MPVNVNCESFRSGGDCLHQAAPRRLFGAARCIVWQNYGHKPKDPRLGEIKCVLCVKTNRPPPPGQPYIPQAGETVIDG
jgi:hypothetical protein